MIIRNHFLRFRSSRIFCAAVTLAVLQTSRAGAAATLESVLKDPRAYDHQHVVLVGVVRGNGPNFELFANAKDAQSVAKASNSVLLVASDKWKGRGPYSMRLVRVSGIVEANKHGLWGNPCEISLENIEVLSGPVAPWSIPFAVFRNEDSKPVAMRVGPPRLAARFSLDPKEVVEVPISNGLIRVLSVSGSLLAEAPINALPGPPYYDGANGAAYYRIRNKRIERVLPAVGRSWGWRR
jgi:hypothetical protein